MKEPDVETVTLTKDMIEAVMTAGVGLSPAKYKVLGGEEPMSKGWKDRLVGNLIPASDYELLRNTVGMKRRDFKRLQVETTRDASRTAAAPEEPAWDKVAGINGKLPKQAAMRRRRRNTKSRPDVVCAGFRNTNSYSDFMARQLPLLLTEPSE